MRFCSPVPAQVPFAMGSLGFMTPFGISHMEAVLSGVTGLERGVPLMLRHRLQVCEGAVYAEGWNACRWRRSWKGMSAPTAMHAEGLPAWCPQVKLLAAAVQRSVPGKLLLTVKHATLKLFACSCLCTCAAVPHHPREQLQPRPHFWRTVLPGGEPRAKATSASIGFV